MVSESEMRLAMGKFPTGVAVITTVDNVGSPHAMTANSLTSISLMPPLLLIAIGHGRNTFHYITENARFGISILCKDQAKIARESSVTENNDDHKRNAIPYILTEKCMPMIAGCLAFLDCSVQTQHVYGDHTVFIGLVTKMQTFSGSPLLFYGGQWAQINLEN